MEEEQPISRQAAFLKAHALWLQAATTAAMEYMQTHPGTRWEAAMKAVAPDLWPEPLYEDYVKPKGKTVPPIHPAHIADKPTGGWSSWIGLGIVAAALTCIIVAMAVGPYLPQKISSPDSGQVQTPSVPRTDNPPYEIPAVPVKPPPATTSDNPYQDHPSPKPAEETPSSANKHKFHKPFVYPPSRNEIDDVIKSGRYTKLPPAEVVSQSDGSELPHVRIMNQTSFTVSISFDGPKERTTKIAAGRSVDLAMEPGHYRVFGKTSDPLILPLLGFYDYSHGFDYTLELSIEVIAVP